MAPGLRRAEVRGWNQSPGQPLLAPHFCLGFSHLHEPGLDKGTALELHPHVT